MSTARVVGVIVCLAGLLFLSTREGFWSCGTKPLLHDNWGPEMQRVNLHGVLRR